MRGVDEVFQNRPAMIATAFKDQLLIIQHAVHCQLFKQFNVYEAHKEH